MTTEAVLENLPGAVLVCRTTEEKQILFASKGMAELFGYETVEEFLHYVGNSYQLMIYAGDEPRTMELIWKQIEKTDGFFQVTHRVILPDQSFKTVTQTGHLVKDSAKERLFYVFCCDAEIQKTCADVRVRVDAERKRLNRTGVDEVTGFVQKDRFVNYAKEEIERIRGQGRRVMVLNLNMVGYFTYGCRYGTKMLNMFAWEAARLLRKEFPDHLIGRVEEDSFFVITPESNVAHTVARLKDALRKANQDSVIDMKAGSYLLGTEEENEGILSAMEYAKSACNSILMSQNIFYRAYGGEKESG